MISRKTAKNLALQSLLGRADQIIEAALHESGFGP
jgi:hypothetical protein